MKRIIVAMAAIVAAFTMASCNKEQLVEPENNITPTEGNCIITASTESTLTKTSLEGDDTNGYDVVWSEGDKIKIGGNEFTLTDGANSTTGKFQGTLPEGDGPFTAYYPATYNGTDWPSEQTYAKGNITGSPMIAEVVKGAESFSFKNKGGILRLTVKGTATIKTIKVSATDLKDITLNCEDGVELDNTNGTVFHIAIPEGDYSGVSIYFGATDDNYCIKTLKKENKLKIIKSEITPASFTTSFTSSESTDPLSGAFTVDSYGKQVCFSKGNLRYSRNNSGKWSFFDKQYKCGPDNYAGHEYEISLFTWGYDATQSINPEGNSSKNVSITSGNLSSAQDWGSVIADGNAWRTLTSDEWHYLFVDRPDAADKFGYATVDGKKGLIILPDEFTDPKKNGGSGAFVPGATTGYNANVYSLGGNWEAMEAAGAVFLPAAGRRSGHSIAYVGEFGCYWSSSAKDSDNAYYVEFNSRDINAAAPCSRGLGGSVRLVKDIASTATTKGHAVATVGGKATYVNWIQLWENGPKFAEYNVGAKSLTEDGGLYCWGCTVDKDYKQNYFGGPELGDHDTASLLWGSNWRMPTKEELGGLLANCDVQWIDGDTKKYNNTTVIGLLCTGKGNYSGNSIFLHAAGYIVYGGFHGQGISGCYWSSTPNSSYNFRIYRLVVNMSEQYMDTYDRDCGYSVRAVLAE